MENLTQTQNLYLIIGAAILPAVLLVWYIYKRDKYQPEPLSQILRGVGYGIISAILALFLEQTIQWIIGEFPEGWGGAILKGFVGAAIPEEAAKLLMLYLLLRRNPYFDERFDGIVYAVCIGMGFAGTENIIYLIGHINVWQSVAISRAIFAVPCHFFLAVAMGYFYAMIYFDQESVKWPLMVYIVPVLLHGIYDSLLFVISLETIWSGLLLIVFYVFCFRLYRRGKARINEHLERDRHDPTQRAFYMDK